MKKLSISFAFSMFLFQISLANIYYVSTTGNDASGDGSAGMPWRTLLYTVTRVAANQGHTIQLASGTFLENGLVEVPLGVNVIGAGIDQTILGAASSFYYNPATPGYATDKFLISLNEFNQLNGNQTLKGFTIDGGLKQLHGGIYVRHRNNVTIDGVKVQNTNFSGIWLWDVKDSKLINSQLINCSWGSSAYCSGALNLGNLERVEVDQLNVDENTGYGIKAIGPGGSNDVWNLKIHDSRISVNPFGIWNGGSAPNIAIELWQVNLIGNEIYNCYVDNTISLVNSNATPSTGVQTIRVHHNTIDMDTRARGAGYGVELTIHDAEVDHNYFVKGNYGIANWDNPMINWSIHHNTFYAIQGTYPGEVVRSQWSGLHNVKLYSNTIEFASDKTMNVVGLYGGTSDNIDIQNNLFMDNNTGYSYYPNQLVHLENNAVLATLAVKNNLFSKLPVGSIPGTYQNNITTDPLINFAGLRTDPYYLPKAGSPLIDAGVNLGFSYLGSAPDIGAFEYAVVTNVVPQVSITSPVNNANFIAGATVTINATATDIDGTISKVEFYNGATLLGQDLASPYSFTWSGVPAGNYSLIAKATDNQNAVTTSTALLITVTKANVPPVVSLTSPSNNASFTSGSSITIIASATDSNGTISKVEFFYDAKLLSQDFTSPYSFAWTNLQTGTYSLTAKATDNQNAVTTSTAVSITVTNANVPPVVSLTGPVNNASVFAGSSITIAANATDANGTISKVEFYNGATLLGVDVTSPYSFVWTNLPAGNHSLTAKATDNQNAVATSIAVAIVAVNPNIAPAVSLTAPVNSANFTTGSNVTITANATDSDGTITKVEFYNGATLLGQSLTAPYSFVWNSVPAGTFTLSVSATDNIGATTASSSTTIIVSTPALLQLGFDSSDAALSGQMTLGYDVTAAMGTYFSVPPGNGRNYYIPAPATATFNFNVPTTDNFVIWAKVKSLTDQSQRYYIYNGQGRWFTWLAGIHTNWAWVKITDAGVDALFSFGSGANNFQMAWFDENVQVDQIVITNDLSFAPLQDPVIASQLAVYPNPVIANYFTIKYTSPVSQQAQVSIFDNAATLVKQTMVNLNAGTNDVVVDTNYIYNGPYIVAFQPTNGQKSTARIIISR